MRLLVATVAALAAIAILVRAVEARFAFFPNAGERPTPDDLGLAFEWAIREVEAEQASLATLRSAFGSVAPARDPKAEQAPPVSGVGCSVVSALKASSIRGSCVM